MNKAADFYLFQGDGNFAVVSTLRACRKISTVEHSGRTITLVNVDPPVQAGILVPGVRNDVLGMSSYGPKHFDRLSSGEIAQAMLWEVYDFGGGKYGVAMEPTLGRARIYRSKPAIDSQGNIMEAPPAAKAFVNSIIKKLTDPGSREK
jgi:hypothetical protein